MLRRATFGLISILISCAAHAQQDGWRVSGKVTDAEGAAVAGTRVASTGALDPVPCVDGTFDLPLAPAPWLNPPPRRHDEFREGNLVAFLYVHPPGGWIARYYALPFHYRSSHAPPRPAAAKVQLQPGVSTEVRGTLHDALGNALPHSLLLLHFERGHTFACTDAQGRFRTAGALPSAELRVQVFPGWEADEGAFELIVSHNAAAPVAHELQIACGPHIAIELLGTEPILANRLGLNWRARLRERHADGRQRQWSWRQPNRHTTAGDDRGLLCYPRAEFEPAPGMQAWLEVETDDGLWSGLVPLPADAADWSTATQVRLRRHAFLSVQVRSTGGGLAVERLIQGELQPGLAIDVEPLDVHNHGPFPPRPARRGGYDGDRVCAIVPDPGRYRVTVRAPDCAPEVLEVVIGDDDLVVQHILLTARGAADVIEGTVEVPLGEGCPIAVAHLMRSRSNEVLRTVPALPPLVVRSIDGKCVQMADATSPTARFRFTDVPPGDYTVSIETLDRRLPDPKVYCRDVSVPARDFQTLHFPLPGNRADTLAWSIVTPAGAALERAPIALQSPNWPMPLLYDVPLARPVLRWDRSLPLSWCVRVPGCQPSWGDRNSWPQETTRLPIVLQRGWGFELALREGRADGPTRDSARERWHTLVHERPLAGVRISLDDQEVGVTDANGLLRVVGETLPERWGLRLAGHAAAGHQGWIGHANDVRTGMCFDSAQVIWRMVALR